MKRWLEDISVEMGLDGEITDEVLQAGERRMSVVAPQTSNSHLEKIKKAIERFEGVREKWHSQCGEKTDAVFQKILLAAPKGKVEIPYNETGWALLQIEGGSLYNPAAVALHNAAHAVVDLIQATPKNNLQSVKKYLKEYCWQG